MKCVYVTKYAGPLLILSSRLCKGLLKDYITSLSAFLLFIDIKKLECEKKKTSIFLSHFIFSKIQFLSQKFNGMEGSI